jgi:hypothetical protein
MVGKIKSDPRFVRLDGVRRCSYSRLDGVQIQMAGGIPDRLTVGISVELLDKARGDLRHHIVANAYKDKKRCPVGWYRRKIGNAKVGLWKLTSSVVWAF